MDFNVTSFSAGLGVILTGFFFAWVFGLVAKMLDVGAE